MCNFSLATKDRDETDWHKIVSWGKTADVCAQHLRKGSEVCVVGKLTYNKWEDRDGNRRVTAEVVAFQVVFVGPKPQQGGYQDRNQTQGYQPSRQPLPPGVTEMGSSDGIPF